MLWTRLAPDPLNGGGMGHRPVEVRWRLATGPDMRRTVRAGTATAHPRDGYAVLVNVEGLNDDTWYYYQFEIRGEHSRIGRTRTFPAPGMTAGTMRFALVSCQDYQTGYYAAYRDIATQELDFVVHVGDYIYESARQSERACRASAHRRGDRLGRRLSQPLRAVPARPAAAGRPRRVPVHRHLGRSRGRQQLRRR